MEAPSAENGELSFSRVQAYQRCPWLYHLVYDLGWRAAPTAGSALGHSLHRALARFASPENKDRTLDRLLGFYDEEWVNEGFESPQATIEAYESGRAMLERFHASEQMRAGETVGTEVDFNVPFGDGFRFRGSVDRLDRRPDGVYEVVEYKTQGAAWNEERTRSDLQMTLYALGIRTSLNGEPVALRYHFLSTGESRSVMRTEEQLRDAEAVLASVGARIRARDFAPDNRYCARCEFGRRCEFYHPMTEKEPS
ncbi:MAG: PD-(D/E)XK nuclease family protein [Elusimicrobia bacterium]|nr:PD-(D/E)XK nuclease family protein [Elusimicrobiota bacterium]